MWRYLPLIIALIVSISLGVWTSVAWSATIPQMDECGLVATSPHQSITMGQVKPHGTIWSCDWFAGRDNPLEYDALADLKGPHSETSDAIPPSLGSYQVSDPVPVIFPKTATTGTDIGSRPPPSWPPSPPPVAPVPLPATAWLLLGALALLWGMRRGH